MAETIDRASLEEALNIVRPSLQADGGDVSLVGIREDGTVELRLTGACHGCPMSAITLRAGIERFLISAVPGVKQVIAVE